jgi:hypothetical protein
MAGTYPTPPGGRGRTRFSPHRASPVHEEIVMTVDSPQYSTPPPAPPAPPAKKGLNVWGWLAIGCVVVLLLALGTCFAGGMFLKNKLGGFAKEFEENPAKVAAELAVKMNPDVEMVSSDDTTMTVRNVKTGEVVTVDFEDAKEGKFTFETKDGKATVDADAADEGGTLTITGPDGQKATFGAGAGTGNAPAWLPIYPGAQVVGNYDGTTPEGHAGAVTVTTSDSLAEVMAFYEEKLRDDGFEVQKMTIAGSDGSGGTVTGTTADQSRTVSVVLSVADGQTQAMVTFNEKN